METIEDFYKEFDRCSIGYFKKHFLDKPLLKALDDTYMNEITNFAGIYTRFEILKNILIAIQEEEEIPQDVSEILDAYIKLVTKICDELKDLLDAVIY